MALLRRLGTRQAIVLAPLAPWVAALPALALGLVDPVARQQLRASALPVALYLLGWSLAVTAGVWIWRHMECPSTSTEARATMLGAADWSFAVPLLAFAALIYWNSAVLDPLQGRGFPDYMTQMKGARKLLDGALPYDPTIRVWTDVNLT